MSYVLIGFFIIGLQFFTGKVTSRFRWMGYNYLLDQQANRIEWRVTDDDCLLIKQQTPQFIESWPSITIGVL